NLQFAFRLARVIGGGKMLAAVFDPFDRPAGEARGERDQKILGIEFAARAKTAADVVFHHANRALRQLQLLGQNAPVEEGDFGPPENGGPQVCSAPLRNQPARLHRHRAVTLHREFFAAHESGVLECAVRVAAHARKRERAVRARRFEQQAAIGPRGRAGGDRRQRLDRDRDRIQRVLGRGGTLGENEGERLADVADLVVGDDRLLERLELRGRILPQRNRRYHRADLGGRDDGVHAGTRAGGGSVDRADTPVRHRAAQDHRVQEIFAAEIVDESAAPAQQPQILDALDRAADEDIRPALLVHVLYYLSRRVGKGVASAIRVGKIVRAPCPRGNDTAAILPTLRMLLLLL